MGKTPKNKGILALEGRNRTSNCHNPQPSQLPAVQASALVPQCFQHSQKGSLASRTISEGVATISNPTPNYCGTIILLELLLEVEFNENIKLFRAVCGLLEI